MHRTAIHLAALLLAGFLLVPEALAQTAHRSTDPAPTRQPVSAGATDRPTVERLGTLTIYPDRAAFDAAHPGLPVEDFEDLAVPQGSWCASPSPADASTNNGCVSAGDIAEGLAVAAVGPAQDEPDALVAWDGDTFSNPSIAFGANFFVDDTEVRFDPGVAAAAMNVYAIGSGTVLVSVFDTSDRLLGSTAVPAPALHFVGVSSDAAPIGRIHFGLPGDLLLVDDVAFGGGACEQSLSATVDDATPAPGQVITFTVTVTNNGASPAPLDLWLDATGPVSRTVRLGRGTLPAGAAVTRDVRLRIPGNAPSGTYDADLNIGDFATNDVCDAVNFQLVVSGPATGDGAEFEVVEGLSTSASAVASEAAVAPNPFARETTITYEVAEAAEVRLAVYDVLGRQVAVLVDGRLDAGTHRATFDASGLTAGVYVYRLVVGNDVQAGRMTLTR